MHSSLLMKKRQLTRNQFQCFKRVLLGILLMNLGNSFHQLLLHQINSRFRDILDLKKINECREYFHFKTHNLQKILKMVKLICFMLSLDIKDTYYSVPVDQCFQKYLKYFKIFKKFTVKENYISFVSCLMAQSHAHPGSPNY